MSDGSKPTGETRHQPFVPESMSMTEFTLRALIPGLLMTLILGAANAYLGLKAGQTIAATYPAAVMSMVILRLWKGSILEENIARTAGSIGESVAAGAIFTLPAFYIAGVWPSFSPEDAYWKSTALMLVGGILGVLFCSLVRRVMVEDRTLPFPESVAASEIHKAGRRGADAAKYLFQSMGFGAGVYLAAEFGLFRRATEFVVKVGTLGMSKVKLGAGAAAQTVPAGGQVHLTSPEISPAYIGVGYIIGPELAALNFSGGVLAWGLLVPLLIYLMGPELQTLLPQGSGDDAWGGLTVQVWRFIVRPIAVGGMLVGTVYTLYRRRQSIFGGLSRALKDLAPGQTVIQDGVHSDRCDVRADGSTLRVHDGTSRRWHRGGHRDAHRGILLRDRVGLSGGSHRFVEQPHLGAHAIDAHHRGTPHGGDGSAGQRRCGGRVGCGGGGVCVVGGGG
jgi:putative OPT family oligopeptide transporter